MIIKGFYHILLQHHWYSIVVDQLRILITSGLYDSCGAIYISCIGDDRQKDFLDRLFIRQYPKLKVIYYGTNPKEYEFPALRYIEQMEGDYVGFYFHTKGVTKPNDTVKAHWRSLLNEAILNQWNIHYKNVAFRRYDVSSINYLESPDHFSGNFWWFNRNYIRNLPKIDSMNLNNRYNAEQWVCRGHGRYFVMPFKNAAKRDVLIIQKPKR